MNLLVGEKINRLFLSTIQNYSDCILKINTQFVGVEVLLWPLRKSFLCELIFRLQRENLLDRGEITWKGTHLAIFLDLFRTFLLFGSWCGAFRLG